jgi:AcrR family transcriptional regulator
MSKSDLKEKTIALRKQHILEAAISVFERHGYRGATIKMIAEEAGVSDGTIYNVFENKEAILFAVLDALLRGNSAPEPDAIPNLEDMIAARWAELTPETLSMLRVIWSEALTDRALAARYMASFMAPTLGGLEPLLAGPSPTTALEQRSAMALFMGFTLLRLLGDPVVENGMADVPQTIANLLTHGLAASHKNGGNNAP